MFRSSNIRMGVSLLSIVLVTLLMWLSISFLLIANSERLNAQYLSTFIETDKILREASITLSDERSTSYYFATANGQVVETEAALISLATTYRTTDEAVYRVISRLHDVIEQTKYSRQLRFQPQHINELIRNFEIQADRLVSQRTALTQHLETPSNMRSQISPSSKLRLYTDLIDELQGLRYGLSYVSSLQNRDIRNTLEVSNAAWNIESSNRFLTVLFDDYITTGNTAHTATSLETTELHKNIADNLETIKQTHALAGIDNEIHQLAANLSKWYAESYRVPTAGISSAIANSTDSPTSYGEWNTAANRLAELTQMILKRADFISTKQASTAEDSADRNLRIDIALILLSGLLLFCAGWLVRKMHHQATHDELTNLPNRRFFRTHIDELIANAASTENISLLKIDLHKFKTINDSFGQGTGDKLLQRVSTRLQQHAGPATLIARLSGDEYAVVLPETNRTQAELIACELADRLTQPYQIDGQKIQLNNYVGYASFPEHATDTEELRKAVDLAMHEAKQTGPNSIIAYHSKFATAFQERQLLECDLSKALERNEFELHYQPQFDLENEFVDGVEALIRWRHPSRGMVSPFHFIPVAEDTGLLPTIGEWVINEAARQAVNWQKEFGLHLRMSVNVSTHQFLNGDIVELITQTLQREKLAPLDFEIEITESVAISEIELIIAKLEQIRALGVRVAMDDFGTGYSSLSYIQDIPLDTLKIDKAFIDKIDNGTNKQRQLLESIATMARLLGFHTVAEGVETDNQLNQVRALGIDTVQGYYYSKPVPAELIPEHVAAINSKYNNTIRKAA